MIFYPFEGAYPSSAFGTATPKHNIMLHKAYQKFPFKNTIASNGFLMVEFRQTWLLFRTSK